MTVEMVVGSVVIRIIFNVTAPSGKTTIEVEVEEIEVEVEKQIEVEEIIKEMRE